MAISEAAIKHTFNGTGALLIASILPAGIVLVGVRNDMTEAGYGDDLTFSGIFFTFVVAYIIAVLAGWATMLMGLVTPYIAKLFDIQNSSLRWLFTILYFLIFSTITFYILTLVMEWVSDPATLQQIYPSLAFSSFVVSIMHAGMFKELLSK